MNGSEEEFAGKIKTYLDRSAADLAPGVAYRLREMRMLALDRLDGYQEAPQQALSAAGVHGLMGGGRRRRPRFAALTVAMGVLLLGVSVLGYQQWHVVPANQGVRGTRRADPVVGPAHRRLPRHRIPGLAQDVHRQLIAAATLALALAMAPVAGAQLPINAPHWSELTPQQRTTLAPLAPEWDKLDGQRRQKWLGMAERYPKMTPDQQTRFQSQMRTWATLTPDQRHIARAQYQSLKTLPPDKRADMQKKWEEYRNLPPEKQQELRARSLAQSTAPTAACGTARRAAARCPCFPPHLPNSARVTVAWCRTKALQRLAVPSNRRARGTSLPAPVTAGRAAPLGRRPLRTAAADGAGVHHPVRAAATGDAGACGQCANPGRARAARAGLPVLRRVRCRRRYLCWCWTGGRRTLAQKTWRLRLVTREGETLDRRHALLRYFALWVGPLIAVAAYALLQPYGLGKLAAMALAFNFLWALIDGDREFLHDRIAGTRLLPAN